MPNSMDRCPTRTHRDELKASCNGAIVLPFVRTAVKTIVARSGDQLHNRYLIEIAVCLRGPSFLNNGVM